MTGRRRHAARAVIGLIVAAAAACGSDTAADPATTTTALVAPSGAPTAPTSSSPTAPAPASPPPSMAPGDVEIEALVATMAPEDKARQVLVSGVRGGDLTGAVRTSAGSLCVGGVFVANTNTNWSPADDDRAATAAIAELTAAGAREGCVGRPLVLTDGEPGAGLRVPIDPLDSAPDITAAHLADPSETRDALVADGRRFVTALRDLGVHVNLGVVADVDLDPTHYMARRQRSFGADPAQVATLTAVLVELHCAGEVAPTLKHFPNQGSTLEDPHLLPSTAVGGESAWREAGRQPYVDTRAPVVMTGHVFFDTDPDEPSSLSPAVTTGLLRDELGFEGVIVTDDLFAMRGIDDVVPEVGDRAVAAISAGADLALFVVEDEIAANVASIVARADTDASFARRLDESVARVLALKASFGLVDELDPAGFPLCGDAGPQ